MVFRKLCCGVLLATGCSMVAADAAAPFLGKWNFEWQTGRGSYVGEMEITADGGSWQTATSNRRNPCFGRKVPLQHDVASAERLELTLKFSDVIPDCKNATVKLWLNDKGEVVGKRSGQDLTLKRE